MNSLYVIATPIGNIKDISTNFLETINQLDVLFCEDTRVTAKLLSSLEIKKDIKLISVHKFNEKAKIDSCLELIKTKQCGYVSDAGYPTISDPGYLLVDACYQNEIKVEVIDGPSAVTHALAQCGFDTRRFFFLGFLSRTEKEIQKEINDALKNNCPVVIFEAVHRINQTLNYLKKMELKNRIYIGRELTKKFETVTRDYICNLTEQVEKGEFVIIIEPIVSEVDVDINHLIPDYEELIKLGLKPKDACKFIAYKNPSLKANDLYQQLSRKDK